MPPFAPLRRWHLCRVDGPSPTHPDCYDFDFEVPLGHELPPFAAKTAVDAELAKVGPHTCIGVGALYFWLIELLLRQISRCRSPLPRQPGQQNAGQGVLDVHHQPNGARVLGCWTNWKGRHLTGDCLGCPCAANLFFLVFIVCTLKLLPTLQCNDTCLGAAVRVPSDTEWP
jgi:hypothetical protein